VFVVINGLTIKPSHYLLISMIYLSKYVVALLRKYLDLVKEMPGYD